MISSLFSTLGFNKNSESYIYIEFTTRTFEHLKLATQTLANNSNLKVKVNLIQNTTSALIQVSTSNETSDQLKFVTELKNLLGPDVNINILNPNEIKLGTQDDFTSL